MLSMAIDIYLQLKLYETVTYETVTPAHDMCVSGRLGVREPAAVAVGPTSQGPMQRLILPKPAYPIREPVYFMQPVGYT